MGAKTGAGQPGWVLVVTVFFYFQTTADAFINQLAPTNAASAPLTVILRYLSVSKGNASCRVQRSMAQELQSRHFGPSLQDDG